MLHRLAPKTRIDMVAFPGGYSPRNSRLISAGTYKGYHYSHIAGFMAFGEPAPAPAARRQDRLHIRRIVACEGPLGVTYWLNRMHDGVVKRYVSDGDPATTTVPSNLASSIDRARLNGSALRLY